MRKIHPARIDEESLRQELREERTRGSGPGGQHRNRVATAIRLTHLASGVMGQASERRSQQENRRVALRRLRLNLALQVRSEWVDDDFVAPGAFEPSELWRSRLQGTRVRVNPEHRDFPALLAEALDALDLYEDDVARCAEALRVTRSQLVKFLALEPAALAALNGRRQQRGERPLRANG